MTSKILEKLSIRLERQINNITEDIIGSPKISVGNEDFRWKCGYVSALKQLQREVNELLKNGEDAE